jgi:hypothetical protein
MRKNYHQVRKQRELARKTRQQEKEQRRSARQNPGTENPAAVTPEDGSVLVPDPSPPEAS